MRGPGITWSWARGAGLDGEPGPGAAGSICCEVAQLWTPSRHASALDVAMNAIGAAAGVSLHRRFRRGGTERVPAPQPQH